MKRFLYLATFFTLHSKFSRALASLTITFFISEAQAQNPIVTHCYTADPAPMTFEGSDSLYVYCDEDMNVPGVNDFYYMERWRVYSTADMVNWTDHGVALPRTAFSWGREGTCWASQCVKRGDFYYWYICISKPNDWRHYIGVARSDKPSGPFKDARKQPLFDTGEGGDIDPTVFIDDDGQAYLYWGNNKLRYAKLKKNMILIDTSIGNNGVVTVPLTKESFGGVKVNDKVPEGEDCYEEGPWLDKRGDKYYMIYAAGGVPEHISYSMSDSPTGPWVYKGQVMTQQNTGSFTNHSGIVHFKDKDYFFYHTGWAPGGGGYNRSMSVEEMHFNADGTIQPVTATKAGVKPIATMSPYVQQQAETLNSAHGIEVVGNENTGVYVTSIHTGDSMRVANVDFGSDGPKSITLRVATEKNNSMLIIRQDHAKGKVIAKIRPQSTGSYDLWEEQTFDLSYVPTGVHSLHFSFNGSATDLLFNWDWWQFNTFDTGVLNEKLRMNNEECSHDDWYDLCGRRISTHTESLHSLPLGGAGGGLSPGIYIRGHKKYVIR